MIQIQDGNPETVQLWLAYLRKHQYYGIGMKANFWEFGSTKLENLDETTAATSGELAAAWEHLGQTKTITTEQASEFLRGGRVGDAVGLTHAIPRTKSTS